MILIAFLILDIFAFFPDEQSYIVNAFIMNVLNEDYGEIFTSIDVN